MNQNSKQAVQDEEFGIDEEGEDIDYDAIYGGIDIEDSVQEKSPELQDSYRKIFGDVAKQGAKEGLIALGGTYGDMLSLVGANKQGEAEQSKNSRDFNVLQKMEQPGYKATYSDIQSLSDDDDLVPRTYRLPTSENLRQINDMAGGPGEAETVYGKYAGRIGKLYGSGLAFGQWNPLPAASAGILGQAVEEMGGGPVAQAAAEILALIATPTGAIKKIIPSAEKVALKELGFTDNAIALAESHASKGKKLGISASRGAKTDEAFVNFAKESDVIGKGILEKEIPGFSQGSKHVHKMASDEYGKIVQEANKLKIKNLDPFFNTIDKTITDVKGIIGNNPAAKEFITELTDHMLKVIDKPSADNMIEFYKKLNGLGKWVGRSQKDRIITNVKESIKDTFKAEGKKGVELAENFEKANSGIQRAYKAEKLSKVVNKSSNQNGIDFAKLNKKLDDPDTLALFKEVLGDKQAKNIQMISNIGKKISNFDKAYKGVSPWGTTFPTTVAQLGYAAYSADWKGAALLKVGTAGARKLAELSLRDPRFQNLLIKGLHAIKVESPKLFRVANDELEKYLSEELNLDYPSKEKK